MKTFYSGGVRSFGFHISLLLIKSSSYFPDFIIKVKGGTRNIKTYVVEVKPDKQTKPPQKKRVTKSYIYECKTCGEYSKVESAQSGVLIEN